MPVWLGLAIFLTWFAGATRAPAADWPNFRGGPHHHGVAPGSLPDKPVRLWSFKTDGPVRSSAVIGGGRVYIGSDDGHVYAIDGATGEKLWAYDAKSPVAAPPLLLDGGIYFGDADGIFHAVDAGSGAKRWTYETDGEIAGGANWHRDENGATRIVFGSYDNLLHCVDASGGEQVWTYETNNYVNATPAVFDGAAIVGGCDGFIHVVSMRDGKPIRRIEIGAYIANAAAIVAVNAKQGAACAAENRAFLGHYGNQLVCVGLGARLWEADPELDQEDETSNAASESPESILWSYGDRNFPFFAAPAVAGDRVIIGGSDKRVHCVSAKDGSPLWTFATRGKVDSSAVICGDKTVFGSDDGRVYILALSDGREVWSHTIGDPISGSPAVANGVVVIGSEDGSVYAFGMAAPDESDRRRGSHRVDSE